MIRRCALAEEAETNSTAALLLLTMSTWCHAMRWNVENSTLPSHFNFQLTESPSQHERIIEFSSEVANGAKDKSLSRCRRETCWLTKWYFKQLCSSCHGDWQRIGFRTHHTLPRPLIRLSEMSFRGQTPLNLLNMINFTASSLSAKREWNFYLFSPPRSVAFGNLIFRNFLPPKTPKRGEVMWDKVWRMSWHKFDFLAYQPAMYAVLFGENVFTSRQGAPLESWQRVCCSSRLFFPHGAWANKHHLARAAASSRASIKFGAHLFNLMHQFT